MSYQYQKRLDDAYVMHTYGRLPVEFVRGEGMELFDDTGRAYRDFLAGIGVCSLGHNHPAVTRALTEQVTKLTSVSNYFGHPRAFGTFSTKARQRRPRWRSRAGGGA